MAMSYVIRDDANKLVHNRNNSLIKRLHSISYLFIDAFGLKASFFSQSLCSFNLILTDVETSNCCSSVSGDDTTRASNPTANILQTNAHKMHYSIVIFTSSLLPGWTLRAFASSFSYSSSDSLND